MSLHYKKKKAREEDSGSCKLPFKRLLTICNQFNPKCSWENTTSGEVL